MRKQRYRLCVILRAEAISCAYGVGPSLETYFDKLQGLLLQRQDWWELTCLTADQLRQQFQDADNTAAGQPPQKVSGQGVAA